ncbi:hypothetical protein NDU88_004900 [Pleurodeles waltl]|uniref:Uncharacterized protein n=1 Tax=Pleurodeles waltl TaxID=8319 RepID=A0AAV7QGA6_PLEWA|nr:hypothetical protein NDU88_004900 [Pleurodeles waltl]
MSRTPEVPCLPVTKCQMPAERRVVMWAGLAADDGREVDRAAAGGALRPAEAIGGGVGPDAGPVAVWSGARAVACPSRPLDFGRGRLATIEEHRALQAGGAPATSGGESGSCWLPRLMEVRRQGKPTIASE